MNGDRNGRGAGRRHGRFRKQAVWLGVLALAIYFGYLAYMILAGSEA